MSANVRLLIEIGSGIFLLLLGTFINIKVKFATTEKESIHEVKLIIFRIFLFVTVLASVVELYLLFSSLEPLDKRSLFLILVYSSFLLFVLTQYWLIALISRVIGILEKLPCKKLP